MAVRGRRLTIGLLAGLVVVLVAGSAAAVAISRHQRDIAGAASQSTVGHGTSSPSPRTPAAARASGSATAARATAASAGRSPAASSAAPADPSIAPTGPSNNLTVQISPAAQAHARSAEVQQLLQGYFDSINQHSYTSWTQVVTSSIAAGQTSAQWLQAYATTADSSIWIQSMTDDPLQVKVRFTSQQDPDLAPHDLQVDCINWTLTYQLVSQGGHLLVGNTVPGSASYVRCP